MPVQADLFYFGLNNGPNVIAQFSKSEYRSAKITIQASSNVEHQLSDVYLIHDNKLVYTRVTDLIYTIDPFVDFTANIDSNNVYLSANTTLANTDLVIYATLFDNPVTSADKTIDLEKILESTTSMASLMPDDKTDYAAKLTSSLGKQDEIYLLKRKINESFAYMQTSDFTSQTSAFKQAYITDLTNSINNTSNTLNNSVQSDVQTFYDVSKKIESMSTLTNINLGYSNVNTKGLLDKILSSNGKSLFG
jgi:hypothetical protein